MKRRKKRCNCGKCGTCRKRRWRENNPLPYCYQTLKYNATRRGKEFLLTFDQFCEFCNKTGYLEKKGIRPQNMTIDRIDCSGGYSVENIRAITMHENARKGNFEKKAQTEYTPF